MSKVYDQHRAAFANVSAYVVIDKEGYRVASVAFKYPRDGAGRLFCYLHVFGTEMVRGYASGGGYDKHTAAACAAAQRLLGAGVNTQSRDYVTAVKAALAHDGGYGWDHYIRAAGFEVLQAV